MACLGAAKPQAGARFECVALGSMEGRTWPLGTRHAQGHVDNRTWQRVRRAARAEDGLWWLVTGPGVDWIVQGPVREVEMRSVIVRGCCVALLTNGRSLIPRRRVVVATATPNPTSSFFGRLSLYHTAYCVFWESSQTWRDEVETRRTRHKRNAGLQVVSTPRGMGSPPGDWIKGSLEQGPTALGSHKQEPVALLTFWLPAFGGGGRNQKGLLRPSLEYCRPHFPCACDIVVTAQREC